MMWNIKTLRLFHLCKTTDAFDGMKLEYVSPSKNNKVGALVEGDVNPGA